MEGLRGCGGTEGPMEGLGGGAAGGGGGTVEGPEGLWRGRRGCGGTVEGLVVEMEGPVEGRRGGEKGRRGCGGTGGTGGGAGGRWGWRHCGCSGLPLSRAHLIHLFDGRGAGGGAGGGDGGTGGGTEGPMEGRVWRGRGEGRRGCRWWEALQLVGVVCLLVGVVCLLWTYHSR